MENRNTIIILALVIVILAVTAGVMFSQIHTKKTSDSKIDQPENTENIKTESVEEVNTANFPEHSPVLGDYRIVETQQELAVIETSSGEYYVLGGDGYHTYAGHDSQGNIKMGTYVGKY